MMVAVSHEWRVIAPVLDMRLHREGEVEKEERRKKGECVCGGVGRKGDRERAWGEYEKGNEDFTRHGTEGRGRREEITQHSWERNVRGERRNRDLKQGLTTGCETFLMEVEDG